MMGESKYDVLRSIPTKYIPVTTRVSWPATQEAVLQVMAAQGLTFPVVFKPDVGERGWMVRQIHGPADVARYLGTIRSDFIIQALVNEPLEFGIFYRRFPNEAHGQVTSVVIKEMLSVAGTGVDTLGELILAKDRARLQWDVLRVRYKETLDQVPPKGEVVELVPIGNHCLGTMFLNGNYLINDHLSATFDRISQQIEGFYFGRYDLRAASLDALYAGDVKIMELNGCGGEPAHIYQPGYPLLRAMRDMIRHWRDLYHVSMQNHARGVPFMKWADGWRLYQQAKEIQKI